MKFTFRTSAFVVLCMILGSIGISTSKAAAQETLQKGDKAPDFSLKDQDGHDFKLADYVGKQYLVIFFYPKDESPVCTREVCAFRDAYQQYQDANALVIGINGGSVESHKAFQVKENLPFTLLSDPGNTVLDLFRVKEQDFGNNVKVSGRETFVIGRDGTIVYSFRDFMNGNEHAKKVLSYLTGQ